MSHYWGCVGLSAALDTHSVYTKMQKSMGFFKADAHVFFESADAVLANDLLFTTPETANCAQLCRNERYVLVATCRLDNRNELATKLQLTNTQSDHEYLLAAYTAYGQDCAKHLLGDFSFAVWDTQQRTLFIAKDQLGIKPLFYYQDHEKFVFATTMQAIKAVVKPTLNHQYIARELKFYPPDFDSTFFANIHRFTPAHFAVVDTVKGMHEKKRYWELKPIDISAFNTTEALYNELGKRFTEAVMCRTRTNKNVGCQLSGGLDSSAIAVILSRNMPKERLHTYSFVLSDKTRAYSERGIDEQNTQQAVMDYAGLLPENHHKIEDFHFKDVYEELERTDLVMGGFANADGIWQDTLFKTAAENNVGFIMSGFPGDECVSHTGKLYYYDYIGNLNLKKIGRFIMKQPWLRTKIFLSYYLSKRRGSVSKGYGKIQLGRNLLREGSPWHAKLKDGSFKFYPTFKEYLKNEICRPHTTHRTESEGAYALTHGMETVYPLADIRLIELVYSLPTEMFTPEPYTRAIFRNMCIGILPENVRTQPKFSGATTLAFADYWKKKRMKDLEGYEVKDALNMLIPEEKLNKNGDMMDLILAILYYSLDYYINKYSEEQQLPVLS